MQTTQPTPTKRTLKPRLIKAENVANYLSSFERKPPVKSVFFNAEFYEWRKRMIHSSNRGEAKTQFAMLFNG